LCIIFDRDIKNDFLQESWDESRAIEVELLDLTNNTLLNSSQEIKISDFLDDLLVSRKALNDKISLLERKECNKNIQKARDDFERSNKVESISSANLQKKSLESEPEIQEFVEKISRQNILDLINQLRSSKESPNSSLSQNIERESDLVLMDEAHLKLMMVQRNIQDLEKFCQNDLRMENQVKVLIYFASEQSERRV